MKADNKNYYNIFFTISATAIIITCFVVWHYRTIAGPIAPLHYNVVSGFDEIGKTTTLYELPVVSTIVLILNFFISRYLNRLGSYISAITSVTSAVVSLLFLFSVLLLWRFA